MSRLARALPWTALLALAVGLCLQRILSADYWWLLRTGRLIAETGYDGVELCVRAEWDAAPENLQAERRRHLREDVGQRGGGATRVRREPPDHRRVLVGDPRHRVVRRRRGDHGDRPDEVGVAVARVAAAVAAAALVVAVARVATAVRAVPARRRAGAQASFTDAASTRGTMRTASLTAASAFRKSPFRPLK